jgi:hypothetical protein
MYRVNYSAAYNFQYVNTVTFYFKAKELDETRRRSSALSKELELNQITMKQLKGRIHQLQELLAAREQEHRFVHLVRDFIMACTVQISVFVSTVYWLLLT